MVVRAPRWLLGAASGACAAAMIVSTSAAPQQAAVHPEVPAALQGRGKAPAIFAPSEDCLACHNGMRAPSGEDVSIGSDWRASIMANSGRDPYWIASVRREISDHPTADGAIQDECSVCHLPMARTTHRAMGQTGQIFSHMPVRSDAEGLDHLAHDGVSCTVCHQITPANFGTPQSYTGGYVIDTAAPAPRPIFGPFEIDTGRTTVMRSSSGFTQQQAVHVQQSELCATCHTLITTALGERGEEIGRLPEQMPYEEWRHSSFPSSRSCQSCHMPVVEEDTPISSVLGQPRQLLRHQFVGGNFFMLRMLNRFRDDLAVAAPSLDLDRSALHTIRFLQNEAASVAVERTALAGSTLAVDVSVRNLSGHKLPTGYPSRRAWVHLVVRDGQHRVVFESGALTASGAIAGNDNDRDASTFEPHYREITSAGQVQIYESVMADAAGAPTTGLLRGVRYLKDNRLLPDGFDKTTAAEQIAVVGDARGDDDFRGGGDRVRYRVAVSAAEGPFSVEAELRYQPIGFRWAQNLTQYGAAEAQRFVRYYDSLSSASSEVLARSTAPASSSTR
jgi:hypothetical protein